MANPLPHEEKLYKQIKKEHIIITPEVWDLLYNRLGDDITFINFLCQYHLQAHEEIPAQEAKKILRYTRHIKDIVNQLTCVSKEKLLFPEVCTSIPLHPVIREMFTHYIGNDVYAINLMVGDSTDRIDSQPIPVPIIERILERIHCIKVFITKLLEATSPGKEEKSKPADSEEAVKPPLTRREIFLKMRSLLTKEFKFSNEDKIKLESQFNKDLGLDSVDTIRAQMVLEKGFELEIPDEDAQGLLTVAQAVSYIHDRLKKERRIDGKIIGR